MAIPKPNIATAAKAKTTSAAVNAKVLAAAAKESPLINPNQVQNQGTDGSSQGNKSRPGFEGPSPNIPEVSKPGADSLYPKSAPDEAKVNEVMGRVSNADALKQLAGMVMGSTAGSSAVDQITALTAPGGLMAGPGAPPPFDQGFGSQLSNLAANMVPGGNPMAAFQSASVGGPLGALTQSEAKTLTDFNKTGMIAAEKKEAYPGLTSAGNATTNEAGEASEKKPTTPAKEDSFWQKLAKVFTGQTTQSGEKTDRQKQIDQSMLEIPAEENASRGFVTQTLLDQLNASKAGKPTSQGGSGDATPVDNGGISQVVNNGSLTVKTSSLQGQKLFGQPGGSAIGENISGGNKGLNGFGKSNGAGAIDPGNEAGIPGGDPRFLQDPANAMPGNKPAPTLQSPVGNQENQNSSVSATLTAGARNLTLTGTALINGTGNALDNLINGNSAANELRGEAGNDSLDGKAGNDLLDGGAGRDQLTGGSGADRFRFATAGAFGSTQADRITDFSRSEGDRIEISRSAFGLSAVASLSFQTVSNDADLSRALGSSSLLVQDLRDGSILFNQNGLAAGVGQGGVFAVVSQGLTLQVGDFALGA